MLDSMPADYHYKVTPKIAGTPTPSVLIDGVGTASLIPYFVRATVNPGADTVAAGRLQIGYPDATLPINPDDEEVIHIEPTMIGGVNTSPCTDLYLVAVGNTSAGPATAAPADYTGNVCIVANTEADAADWQAQMLHYTFDSAEDVRYVRIKTTPVVGSNYMYVSVEGLSYAQ